jgi:hypothetical protein
MDCSNKLHSGVKELPPAMPQAEPAGNEWDGYGFYTMAPELPTPPNGFRWQLMQKLHNAPDGSVYSVFAFQLLPEASKEFTATHLNPETTEKK